MNIYIIRHGRTQSNVKGEYYGSLDIPLDKEGIKQMKELKSKLSRIIFDRVYSSNSARTLESLRICGGNLYNQVQVDQRLSEINFGDFEGRTYKEIGQLFPEYVEEWGRDWKNFCPPNGESFVSFYSRVTSFFKELIEIKEDNILIMTHSGVIKSIYCYILQNNLDLYWNFTCHNGKINVIKYEYENLFIDAINKGGL